MLPGIPKDGKIKHPTFEHAKMVITIGYALFLKKHLRKYLIQIWFSIQAKSKDGGMLSLLVDQPSQA